MGKSVSLCWKIETELNLLEDDRPRRIVLFTYPRLDDLARERGITLYDARRKIAPKAIEFVAQALGISPDNLCWREGGRNIIIEPRYGCRFPPKGEVPFRAE
ncbi:MAG: hypothetical protein Q8N16_01360 [bacterium]|nr:hypothetical protein [bacterium]